MNLSQSRQALVDSGLKLGLDPDTASAVAYAAETVVRLIGLARVSPPACATAVAELPEQEARAALLNTVTCLAAGDPR